MLPARVSGSPVVVGMFVMVVGMFGGGDGFHCKFEHGAWW